ncbi:hypothetical protein H2248_003988 [Termitomyces sp. 'cryptogamus']|nr:hypothetical protein H2248_003988 [Termitomyces sp. 'cryptogamus']
MDLHENTENNMVTATFELPGLKKEDVSIDIHNSRLTISGESKISTEHNERDVSSSNTSTKTMIRKSVGFIFICVSLTHNRGVRQHALLNLVRMHYLRNEVTAARKFLMEAITVARTCGDKIILQHCISMLHRLPPTVPGRKPTLNALQSDLHPLEVLFDVKKLMDTQNDQPLSAAFVKIDQAIGLYDHWLDGQGKPLIDEEHWAQHAVQSVVWNTIGCNKLASIEESIVLAFTQSGTEDHNRITMFLNRAYRVGIVNSFGQLSIKYHARAITCSFGE